MSTQDPRGESQTPEELLAETDSVLGDETPTQADPTAGDTREISPHGQTQPPEQTPPEQTPAGHDDRLPSTKGGAGMSAGMWISLIIGAIIVILLLIFILQNNVPAEFKYFGWQFELPLGVAMLFAAIGGILIAGLIGSVRIFVLSRKLKKINKALGR
ncbi:LapA family protein [Brevibacterium spongiae]|uniref:Lipopolysaccharide assembly protein LapA domain-containing protein n=1 Tax=Brevibacterium spongiae TaxID=2909672 RepID=A0ABY5STV0_9MICO|nr:lipopolysaccharide assembly protein LapA domain-containing protein [Brevibacterium spongiae]UVI37565.1 lipopolysaccharide assembly protein LapA domain-containing protein [Brevibacterium spongiae]